MRFVVHIVLIALLGLSGCVTMHQDFRLVGTYVGADSESLSFLSDTSVYYSRVVDGREQRLLLGYTVPVSSTRPGLFSIFAPDTSPFLGTSFQVSGDFRTVT